MYHGRECAGIGYTAARILGTKIVGHGFKYMFEE